MNSNLTRIPLAIALSSALAFAVGCSDRTADDRAAAIEAADDAAVQDAQATPPVGPTDPVATGDAAYGDAVDDGRDSDQPIDDTWITTKVKSSLLADTDVAGLQIDVETVNGVVTLTGQVEQQSQIDAATRIARDIEGVTDVDTSGLTTGTDR